MATPYDLRFNLISLAKDMLVDEWHAQRGMLESDWNNRVGRAVDRDEPLPAAPVIPPYPTEKDIIAKAAALNDFVSNSK